MLQRSVAGLPAVGVFRLCGPLEADQTEDFAKREAREGQAQADARRHEE